MYSGPLTGVRRKPSGGSGKGVQTVTGQRIRTDKISDAEGNEVKILSFFGTN